MNVRTDRQEIDFKKVEEIDPTNLLLPKRSYIKVFSQHGLACFSVARLRKIGQVPIQFQGYCRYLNL